MDIKLECTKQVTKTISGAKNRKRTATRIGLAMLKLSAIALVVWLDSSWLAICYCLERE